jgi:membrane-associated phospholipid phosphatase
VSSATAAHRRSPGRSAAVWLLLSAILLVTVVGLRLWLAQVGPLPGDRWAALHFQQPWLRGPGTRAITGFYQSFGAPGPALVTGGLGLLLTIAWHQREPGALGGLVIACLAVPTNGLLKLLFGPTALWVQTGRGGTNFPSGHASFVTAVIGYLGLLCWRHGGPWRGLTVLALLLIIGVGPARVIGGQHLVSDVVGGYLVGLALLIVAGVWLDRGGVRGLSPAGRRARSRTQSVRQRRGVRRPRSSTSGRIPPAA